MLPSSGYISTSGAILVPLTWVPFHSWVLWRVNQWTAFKPYYSEFLSSIFILYLNTLTCHSFIYICVCILWQLCLPPLNSANSDPYLTFPSCCGVVNPSWSEVHHFVRFLDLQLKSCEESVFCDETLVGDIVAGLKSFVVKFMIRMSRVRLKYEGYCTARSCSAAV